MITLMRKRFVDRFLEARDLDDALDMWLDWHEQYRGSKGSYRVEARLWCIPRSRVNELRRGIEEAIQREQSPLRVQHFDDDTLVVGSDWLPLSEHVRGLGLPLFAAEMFENLALMLRLVSRQSTIVLCGQLLRERFLLKAIWPVGLGEMDEAIYHQAPWPHESGFLDDLDHFSHYEPLTNNWRELFASLPNRLFSGAIAWLAVGRGPRKDRKLRDLLYRLAVFAAVALFGLLVPILLPLGIAAPSWMVLGGVAALGLVWTLLYQSFWIWKRYTGMNRALRRVYAQPVRHVPLDLAEREVLNNPTAIKYSGDLEALGARHCFDGRPEPMIEKDSYLRIYVLPEDRTYVFLSLMLKTRSLQYFPARPVLVLKTYFDDGHRLLGATGSGYQKLHSRNVTMRRLADDYDLELMLESHRRTIAKLIAEGRTVRKVMSAEQLLDLMVQEHAEAAALRERHGYFTLRAAIRQAFNLPRPEFQPD